VILQSGLRLHADHHEILGGIVRLFTNGGVTELPSGAVAGFEEEDYIPPPPAPDAVMPGAQAEAPKSADPKQLIEAAAQRNGLPKKLVQSVAKAESGLDPKAVSRKGAIGVMQLTPDTARALGADPHDPEQNIEAGTRLLRELLLKYNGDVAKALAAYNAGESAVDRYHGVPPYPETRHYVKKIVRDYLSSND
jgi:soluble lytic murein transglycosylase-like protein